MCIRDSTYIIANRGNDLLIVDQHAADERICYERQISHLRGGPVPIQRLLEGAIIECEKGAAHKLERSTKELEKAGFIMEEFGPGQFRVDGVPSPLGKALASDVIKDALEEMLEEGLLDKTPDYQDKIAKMVACKAAVKANTPLGRDQMLRIVKELFDTENPHNCPHGRPTFLKMSKTRLERDFLRT